jgi:hypothetical protein
LTERDKRLLETIHSHEGILADYQLQRLFFRGRRTAQERLSKLYHNGYLERPDRRRRATLPYMVYWLAEKGAAIVAARHGEEVAGFKYRAKPRWSLVEHDIAINDFRIAVAEAARQWPELTLTEWVPSSEFWAEADQVDYVVPNRGKATRKIRPDGYFVIQAGAYAHRRLLEIDRATEDNPRFGREKVAPGIAYLRSEAYERRMGGKSGRWLVVTTSERKLANLKAQTERVAGNNAPLFAFTTFDLARPETVLTESIWWPGGSDRPVTFWDL